MNRSAMQRRFALAPGLLLSLLLGACAGQQTAPSAAVPVGAQAQAQAPLVDAGGAPIEKVPFHTGVSSNTVEKLARQQGCTGGEGAGLITSSGPVEIYRIQCDSGKVFLARCELRQCVRM